MSVASLEANDRSASYLAAARTCDREGWVPEAFVLYELAVADGTAGLEDYLNLAILYANACDPGFFASHNLHNAFFRLAPRRMNEVFDVAEARFGATVEIGGWRLWAECCLAGLLELDDSMERARALAAHGSEAAALVLWIHGDSVRVPDPPINRLRAFAAPADTQRKRSIQSFLADLGDQVV